MFKSINMSLQDEWVDLEANETAEGPEVVVTADEAIRWAAKNGHTEVAAILLQDAQAITIQEAAIAFGLILSSLAYLSTFTY